MYATAAFQNKIIIVFKKFYFLFFQDFSGSGAAPDLIMLRQSRSVTDPVLFLRLWCRLPDIIILD